MSKLFQALFTGMFITFFLDFFIFLGIQLNYIRFHQIDLYYNILFADHQNGFIFFSLSFILGFLVVYINNTRLSLIIIGTLSGLTLLTLLPSVGKSVGEVLLMKDNVTLNDAKYSYHGDIYYDGRKKITFYDYELEKIILLNKKDLKQ